MNQHFFLNCIRFCTTVTIDRKIDQQPENAIFKKVQTIFDKTVSSNCKVSRDGVVNYLQQIASQMEVATRNHLKRNFFNRLKNYKKLLYIESNQEESQTRQQAVDNCKR